MLVGAMEFSMGCILTKFQKETYIQENLNPNQILKF